MKQEVYDRFKNYKENHCWQYEIRQQNLTKDLKEANLTTEQHKALRTNDFDFAYVEKEAGVYEPREVKVGAAGKDFIPILHGLKQGEKVVISANFLIDSQSQLTSGSSALYGGATEVEKKHVH